MIPEEFGFGAALSLLGEGRRVTRAGWNGRGMFLVAISRWGASFADSDLADLQPAPFIAMRTVDRRIVPWLASQTDVLATDWREVAP